ncbi:MAG: S41 family peptidase, partial [Microgenomates group bacterium]
AISGMVASLGDPYTVFLPPAENQTAKSDLRGDFEGVGIQIDYKQTADSQNDSDKDKKLVVVAPLAGTPAERAGIKAGDVILRIVDEARKIDKSTQGISLPEAVDLIRGPKGSVVRLTIQREGVEKPFEVALKRETIVVKSVELKFQENNGKAVAVLKLSRFGERTEAEWKEAVASIKGQEAKNKNFAGIILDLRNNPGGLLQGSVFIASEFLARGIVVQQDKGVDGKEVYEVDRHGLLLKEPLVVLVNGGSASASEIVAGALQETGRARLVGEKTFGKGTVQEAEDLPGGAGLHVTVAAWLLPSGKSIDKQGVKPDIEIKNEEKDLSKDAQLQKAIELLTS